MPVRAAAPGRIYADGNRLMVDGRRIYLNGTNCPWNAWNEFGSTNGGDYDPDWWESEFGRMAAVGINSARIWISF